MDEPTNPAEPTPSPSLPGEPKRTASKDDEGKGAEPLTREELSASLLRPHRMLDVVLGEPRRLSSNILAGVELRALVLALLVCSTLFTVPFALVDGWSRLAHVAMLYLGTVLLCFPSLLVFSSYLGVKIHAAQSLTIALVIPAAAAVFTLGFAPIYWFLDATMPEGGGVGGVAMRITLLVLSLVLGLSQVNRCLLANEKFRAMRDSWPLWFGWQLLLILLSIRMARTLGLLS